MTEAGGLEMVLISFLVSVIKDPDRSKPGEEGLFSSQVKGAIHCSRKVKTVGPNQEAERWLQAH